MNCPETRLTFFSAVRYQSVRVRKGHGVCMKSTARFTRRMLFSVRWRFMPPQKRYAYLWAKTRRSWPRASVGCDLEGNDTLVGG